MKKSITPKITITLLCAMIVCMLNVSAQNLTWAKSMGGPSFDEGYSIATDALGFVYTTGYFVGTVDFDPGVGVTGLTAMGGDIFIQKLDPAGDLVWVKRIGGTSSNDYGYAIAIDHAGNVCITGTFSNVVDFDPGAGLYNLTGGSMSDIFVLKLSSAGDFLWAKIMGGSYIDSGKSITVDGADNVYTTGAFTNTVDFDPSGAIYNLSSHGTLDNDIFIQKLSASGSFVWAKNMGSATDDVGYAITADSAGNILTAGTFQSTIDFDPGAGISNLTSNGSKDIFIQKLDTAGNFIWAKNVGGTDNDFCQDIVVDNSGNIFTTGRFAGTADFDPSAATFNLQTAAVGEFDFFIQKLDPAGNLAWAKSVGGTENDYSQSIVTDNFGNVFATGYYSGTPDFDPGTGTYFMTPVGGSFDTDIFLLALNSSGIFVSAVGIGSTSMDRSTSITQDAFGNFFATGSFSNIVDFDPGVNTVELMSIGATDIFVAKWIQPLTGIENGQINAFEISIYPNPAKNNIDIQLSGIPLNSSLKMTLLTVAGQEIKEVTLNSVLTKIELDNIASGLYFYQIQLDQQIIKTGKLIVE